MFKVTRKRSYPDQLVVDKGGVVHMLCISHTQVEWYFKGKNNPNNIFLTNPVAGGNIYTLSILKATEDNQGAYVCRGQDKKDSYYTFFLSNINVDLKGIILRLFHNRCLIHEISKCINFLYQLIFMTDLQLF